MPRDHFPHHFRNAALLYLDVELGVGEALKDVFETWNFEGAEFKGGEPADTSANAGRAAQCRIVDHDQDAIGRAADVKLERRRESETFQRFQSLRKGRQRILARSTRPRSRPAEPAMADDRDPHSSSLRELAHSFAARAQVIIRKV